MDPNERYLTELKYFMDQHHGWWEDESILPELGDPDCDIDHASDKCSVCMLTNRILAALEDFTETQWYDYWFYMQYWIVKIWERYKLEGLIDALDIMGSFSDSLSGDPIQLFSMGEIHLN